MKIPSLQNVRNFLVATLAFLILSVLSVYLYSAYLEKPVLSYSPLPFPITATGPIYPGGVATAKAVRCNTSNSAITYKSSRMLKRENSNQASYILDAVEITIQPGCSSVQTRVNVVPEGTPPGYYRFLGVAIIRGLIVEHEVKWNTDVFEVLAKPVVVAPVAPAVGVPLAGASATPLLLPITNAVVKIEVKP